MSNIIKINSPEEIDLNKHGLIEASAGTGKTYTIENLFISILKKKKRNGDYHRLEEILVVTFTEKAASELKDRIRKILNKEIQYLEKNISTSPEKDNADKKLLFNLNIASDCFDSSMIFTIHGFCQRILKQYAFENNQPFEYQVVDDKQIFQKVLNIQMREIWPKKFPDLKDILLFSGFDNSGNFLNKILSVTNKYRPDCGDVLYPPPDYQLSITKIKKKIRDILIKLVILLSENKNFLEEYQELNQHHSSKRSLITKVLSPALELISMPNDSSILEKLSSCIEACNKSTDFQKNGFLSLINKLKEPWGNICPLLGDFVSHFESLRKFYIESKNHFSSWAIVELKNKTEEYKREHGLISYDDMLLMVNRALGREDDILVRSVQKYYAYALVDEFQDTDPVQWSIFKKLFLQGENQILYLIGDPKQAIYSFRGADFYTYNQAKKEINGLSKNGKACIYSITTNWRSLPGLVDIFNLLFKTCSNGWFSDSGIDYQDINSPDEEQRIVKLFSDTPIRSFLNIVDLNYGENGARRGAEAKILFAEFIAAEIFNILNNNDIKIGKVNECRNLNAGDICILVRSRSDVPLIESKLQNKGIPYSFYKKPGLYQSNEALHLSYLLNAISEPSDRTALKKALLTGFFRFKPSELGSLDGSPGENYISLLFDKWVALSKRRDWPVLFKSIVDDSLIYFYSSFKIDRERIITNYSQIIQNLEIKAYNENMDIYTLSKFLNNLISENITAEEDSDLHQLETDDARVQIMTIHASKGLEFPVVFLAGGFTQSDKSSPYYEYHVEKENYYTQVFDLCRTPESKIKNESEQDNENRRLYYVALTRASHKLYIPFFKPERKAGGPITGFIYEILENCLSLIQGNEINNQNIQYIDYKGNILLKNKLSKINHTKVIHQDLPEDNLIENILFPERIIPEIKFDYNNRQLRLESFSALYNKIGKNKSYKSNNLNILNNHEEIEKEILNENEIINDSEEPYILPPGKKAGLVLHAILEEMDFTLINKISDYRYLLESDFISLIKDKVDYYGLSAGTSELNDNTLAVKYYDEIAKIIFNTIKTPMLYNENEKGVTQDCIILGSESLDNHFYEAEFYYPVFNGNNYEEHQSQDAPGIVFHKNGFVTGFIDFIFRKRETEEIFFIDWKSNYIKDGYSKDLILKNMNDQGYALQYKLYTIAIRRWMIMHDIDFEKYFGGFFYIYLRGRNIKTPEDGLYFHKPTLEEINQYEKDLYDNMKITKRS